MTKRSSWLLACFASTLITLLSSQSAHAALAFAITGTNGGTSFTVPASGTSSYKLILYAMVDDSTGIASIPPVLMAWSCWSVALDSDCSSSTADTAGFTHAGTTVTVANVTYQGNNTTVSTAVGFWGSASSGTVGIGASSTASASVTNMIYASNSAFWNPASMNANSVTFSNLGNGTTWSTDNATFATLSGFPNYTAIPVASFTVTFTGSSGGGGQPATAGFIAGTNGTGVQVWTEDPSHNSTPINLQHAGGSTNGSTSGSRAALLETVTFTGSGSIIVTGTVGSTTLSALSSPSVLQGQSTNVAFTLSNTAGAGSDTVSWGVNGTSGIAATITGTSGTGLAPGGSVGSAVGYTAPAPGGTFGFDSVSLSATGTGPTGAAIGSTATTKVNVAGLGAIGAANGSTFGPILTSSTGGIAGLTVVSSGDSTLSVATTATILAGSGTGAVTASWRARLPNEIAPQPFGSGEPIISDVLNLNGILAAPVTTRGDDVRSRRDQQRQPGHGWRTC